jgi:hypothetical protein
MGVLLGYYGDMLFTAYPDAFKKTFDFLFSSILLT